MQKSKGTNWRNSVLRSLESSILHPATLLFLFVLLLFYPLLFTNRVLANGDILHYFYPYRDYAATAFREGRIPLWNPYIFLGAPFLANPQTAVLYPLHWPLSWLPVTRQIYWSAAIHAWILGMGGYALMRRWQMSKVSALTTALILAGSGFYGGLIGHINQMNAAAWLPWGMMIIERTKSLNLSIFQSQEKRLKIRRLGDWAIDIALLAAVVALMLMAGHTQSAYINLFGIGLWALIRTFNFKTQLSTAEHGYVSALKSLLIRVHPRTILVFLFGCLLGALISAAQLLPTLELSALGLRSGGLDYGEASSFSLKPLQILWTLLPSYGLADLGVVFGTLGYTEYVAYVGIVSIFLALFELWKWRLEIRDWAKNLQSPISNLPPLPLCFGLFFAILGLFLAAGRWNPVYYLLFKLVPGFDLFRAPARWMMLYTLGMAVLAGVGISEFRSLHHPKLVAKPFKIQNVNWLLAILIAADLLIAAFSLPHRQTTAPQAVYDLRTAPAFLLTNPQRQRIDPAGTGRFLSMSTITFDPGDMGDYRRILADGGQLDERGFEQLVIAQKSQEILAPNLPLLWRVPAVDGFDGGVLPLQRYNQFLTVFIPPDQLIPDGRLREQIAQMPPTRLLNLLNAQYIITDKVRDLWFEGVYYDRQIGANLAANQAITVAVPQEFEATALDLIAFVDGDAASLAQNQTIAEVTVFADDRESAFSLIAGAEAGAQLADGALDSSAAQHSGATVAFRDVDGGKQEYRVRLSFETPVTPQQITIRHLPSAAHLTIQAATLFDARTQMFMPLLPSDRGHFRLVHSGDVKIYENRDLLPRAYLVHQTIRAQGTEDALAALRSDAFDPASEAIVTGLPALQSNPSPTDFAEIVSYAPERVEIYASSAESALLVLGDAFYPGWRATVDGVETPIYPANHLFRGVPIEGGEHTVIFEFDPQPWRRGLQMSGLGGLLWLGLVIVGIVDRRRQGDRKTG